MFIGVEGPDREFRNTKGARSRSGSSEPEACNGSHSSETKSPRPRNAKDTKQSSKPSSASEAKSDDGEHEEKKQSKITRLGPVPIFRCFAFTIDKVPSETCDQHHKMVPLKNADIGKQDENNILVQRNAK